MAILGQITVDEIYILSVDSDPAASSTVAPIGSLATLDDNTNAKIWLKTGAANNAWSIVPNQANATNLSNGGFVFANANGNLVTNTARAFWDGTGRFSFGLNALAVPQSTIHLDRGNATGSHIRMTAGTTTGVTAGDGTEFGIDDTGAAEIRQYENSNINFYTNNLVRGAFAPNGQFILGSTAPIDITGLGALPIFQIIGTASVQMAGIQYSADTIGPVFNLLKSRGASIGTQGLVSSGDEFGRIQFRASDGVNFQAGASIRALVDGTAAAGSMPGYLSLMTTPTGSTTPIERIRVTSTGLTIHSAGVRLGNETDTTNGNIRFDGSELLGRQGAIWRNLVINPFTITATGNVSTTSGTYSVVGSMTTTPAAGTYLVFFSSDASLSGETNGDVSMHIAGVEQTVTTRNIGITNNFGTSTLSSTLSFMTVATVNGSQVLDIRFRENGGSTLTIGNRSLVIIPIAR